MCMVPASQLTVYQTYVKRTIWLMRFPEGVWPAQDDLQPLARWSERGIWQKIFQSVSRWPQGAHPALGVNRLAAAAASNLSMKHLWIREETRCTASVPEDDSFTGSDGVVPDQRQKACHGLAGIKPGPARSPLRTAGPPTRQLLSLLRWAGRIRYQPGNRRCLRQPWFRVDGLQEQKSPEPSRKRSRALAPLERETLTPCTRQGNPASSTPARMPAWVPPLPVGRTIWSIRQPSACACATNSANASR